MSGFFQHPKSVGMTYTEHLLFSMKLSYLFFCGSVKSIIHAIYPDVYITSSGDYSKLIFEMIHENHDYKQYSSSEIKNNSLQFIWDWNYLKKKSLKLNIPTRYKNNFLNLSPTDLYRFVHDSSDDGGDGVNNDDNDNDDVDNNDDNDDVDNSDNDNSDNIDNIDDGVSGVRFKLD